MEYYMIHCCPSRMWYVKEFLIPSMTSQGIPPDCILIYYDYNHLGNLRAFVDSCNMALKFSEDKSIDGIWHLQDDVVLSKSFTKITNRQWALDEIVCGFTCAYDKKPKSGVFRVFDKEMWFSFPCIRIPTTVLREFVKWSNLKLWQSRYFHEWVVRNKGDDMIFREWLYNHPNLQNIQVTNLAPNIVNHIDDLIGGTVANKQRDADMNTRSIFWDEDDVIEDLKNRLSNRTISS